MMKREDILWVTFFMFSFLVANARLELCGQSASYPRTGVVDQTNQIN